MRLIARVAKVMGVSMTELRTALDCDWTGAYNDVANTFTWLRDPDGFRVVIQVDQQLLDFTRMDRDPEDASAQVAFPVLMTATRAYAAAAWVLRMRGDNVPREVIP
jgi:hypothetical protein